MSLGEKIGDGRTAEVFAWDADRALKLFRPNWGRDTADHEAALTRRLIAAGAPIPAVYGIIEYERRWGVIYERITGPSLFAAMLSQQVNLDSGARLLAETQARFHATQVAGLRSLRERLRWAITTVGGEGGPLPIDLRDAALSALAALPDGVALCHGDYHPENVMLSAHGPLVIDWENAVAGPPAADVARAELLLALFPLYAPETLLGQPAQVVLDAFRAAYLAHYAQITGIGEQQIAPWRLPVTAARLREGIEAETPHLLARMRELV